MWTADILLIGFLSEIAMFRHDNLKISWCRHKIKEQLTWQCNENNKCIHTSYWVGGGGETNGVFYMKSINFFFFFPFSHVYNWKRFFFLNHLYWSEHVWKGKRYPTISLEGVWKFIWNLFHWIISVQEEKKKS